MKAASLLRTLRDPVARNALALYAVQAAQYLFPLMVVPYLARVLKPAGYGMVLLAQSLAVWLALVVEYGFGLSATREVARHKGDQARLSDIVSGVLGAQVLLSLVAIGIAAAHAWSVGSFRAAPEYAWLAWLAAVAQALGPVWYFQGQERMLYPASLNVVVRGITAAATLLWVRQPDDGWKVLGLQAAGGLIVSLLTVARMHREVPRKRPGLPAIRGALQMGWSMFFFRAAVSLYTTANTLILGMFVPPSEVAFYASPEKVSKAVLSGLSPISQALYPRMSAMVAQDVERARRVGRLALVSMGSLGLFLGVATWLASPAIVRLLFGPGYEPAVPVLRVLAWLVPLIAISNVLGIQWMLPCGMDRAFNLIIFCSGILNVALSSILAPRFGAVGMAVAVLVTEAVVTASMVAVLLRHRAPLVRLVSDAS